jgi:hypothetical protein
VSRYGFCPFLQHFHGADNVHGAADEASNVSHHDYLPLFTPF